ncbi:MAG: rod shape-determining protein RodA [Pelagibacterales bacterium]|nr:rod shape-determining protein RodA [Pelagibacterales bacterium]
MNNSISLKYDLISISIYFIIVVFGLVNIFSSIYNENLISFLDLSFPIGKQIVFFLISLVLFFIILFTRSKFLHDNSFLLYFISILLLIGVLFFGIKAGGAKSWYNLGFINFQPSEFVKITTSLFLAKYLSIIQTDISRNRDLFFISLIIIIPIFLISIQPDPGSAIIFLAFLFPIFREGLNINFLYHLIFICIMFFLSIAVGIYLTIFLFLTFYIANIFYESRSKRKVKFSKFIITIFLYVSLALSTNYVFENVLEQRHRDRINIILEKDLDTKGIGYNINQSKIAIGSGGFFGIGFLRGTQTKGDFVPRQHTDYIFSTIGEEWGFLGSSFIIFLFCYLIIRIIQRAEKQHIHYRRIYCYCFASLLFMHFFINIGMSIGILPTIGIPLPYVSYGGSSFLSFSIMFFIYLNFDSSRLKES